MNKSGVGAGVCGRYATLPARAVAARKWRVVRFGPNKGERHELEQLFEQRTAHAVAQRIAEARPDCTVLVEPVILASVTNLT